MTPVKLAAVVMLVSIMLNAGLQCDRRRLVAALKDYRLLVGVLLANVIIIPIVGVIVARAFALEPYVATGFLLMAIAPGAPFLPRAAGRQSAGSLGLAIAMSFILPAVSVVTIPITAPLVLPTVGEGHDPVMRFVTTLVLFQLLPLLIGIIFADRAPAIAGRLERPLVIIFFLTVVALLILLSEEVIKAVMSVYGTHIIWATVVIALVSLATGWILAGGRIEYRRTLAIGSTLRNFGLCALFATSDYPHTPVAAAALVYFIVQFFVTVPFRIFFHRQARAAPAGR